MLTRTSLKTSRRALTLVASAALLSTAMIAAPAQASSTHGVSINIDKTELSTDAGVKRTYYHLKTVANNACQADEGLTDIKRRVVAETCVKNLMRTFVQQIESERLIALHADEIVKAG